jgi:hypothetical protein
MNLITDNGEMDVSTPSRIIKHVSVVIASLRPNFIQMPEGGRARSNSRGAERILQYLALSKSPRLREWHPY